MPSGYDIALKASKAAKLEGSEATSTLTIINSSGQKRVRKMAMVSKLYDKGDTEKRLIRFLKPADVKGTGLLTFDYEKKSDDMWFFMPALRKTRRIVASDKAKNFMGSEFTYADIAPPSVDDFTYKVLRSEKVGGVDCWVLESVPKNDDVAEENGYSKRIGWIGKKDYIIRKAVYHDLDGEKEKVLEVSDVKEIDTAKHIFRPMHMVMINKLNGRKSVLTIDKIKLRSDIPDDYFTTRYLERF
ncbi:MAG: outer membrane lipoprotein-sorting protein [Deltaproteobacteria bacterium]|nr:outer membrane lipoprotein-sorting protein [Deltaproteobacteria bacterium]